MSNLTSALARALPPVEQYRPGEPTPFYSLRLDEDLGVVRAVTCGLWTSAEADEYIDNLARFVSDSRDRYGRAKVLVDRRRSPVQTSEVADRFGEANRTLYRPDDRLAIVVDSYLLKGQVRRRFVHEGAKAFLSYDAAETWLKAWN